MRAQHMTSDLLHLYHIERPGVKENRVQHPAK
jgi:hypothetical protein